MTTDRDPMIGALLDRLEPPPAPDLEFWDDLRQQLDGGPRVVELRPLPPGQSRRDRRRLLLALVAAAVIAAGALGVTMAVRHDDSERIVPANTTTSVETTSSEADRASHAAVDWLQAYTSHDVAAAWALLGPQSRDSLGSQQALQDAMSSGAPQPWEAWATLGVLPGSVLLGDVGGESLWVVELRPRGDTLDTSALVVRLSGSTRSVEAFLPGTALSLVSFPITGGVPSVRPGASIEIHVEAHASLSLVAIDGGVVPPNELQRDASGAFVAVTAPTLIATHDLLVVEVTNGEIALVDQRFTVSG